ncbi:hypothetical protein CASFOL_014197 [Castilleja foliolosa]|uniref:CBS domain-containing protein n=1 Tax=Castilleja foliolosa TaxID=1961234 RepID=A0ABD3DPY1_9LAMI
MAVRILNGDVSELCLGKPELTCVSASSTISDALTALRTSGDSQLSVWMCCAGDIAINNGSCVCVGKFCMADVILFLCREENLADPFKALESPVSDILPNGSPIVRHLQQNSSLLDAIDSILEGTQNLVIPIQNHYTTNSRKSFPNRPPPPSTCTHHKDHKYCWLTQEDVVRFLLNSLGAFSPIPTFTIDSLNITDHDIMTVTYNEPASSALPYFHRALIEQTSIAVVDEQNRLIGEISPFALSCSNETAAGAITALSAVDLMIYIECARPPEDLVQLVKTRLRERNLVGMVEMIDEFLHALAFSSSSSCSSDDESGSSWLRGGSGRNYSARRSEAIVCGPRSSLVAVMIQALAHRVSCVWVVDEGYSVVGAVTFAGILKVFGNVAGGRHNKSEDNSLKK